MKTPTDFRADFPAFVDETMFPDDMLQSWLNVAYNFLNADRWGNSLDLGAELFCAHNATLEALSQKTVENGGIPGLMKGVVSSEGAGGINVSYDTSSATQANAAHWNMTTYGVRFKRISRMMGAGALQIGASGGIGKMGAWPGVIY